MRLLTIIVFMYIMLMGIMIFNGHIQSETQTLSNVTYNFMNNSQNGTSESFLMLVTDPSQIVQWSTSDAILVLAGITTVLGAIGIGLYFFTKSDILLLSGFFILLLGVGAMPIISLYSLVTSEVGRYACTDASSYCLVAGLSGFFTAGILALIYIFTCIEWWTGRGST